MFRPVEAFRHVQMLMTIFVVLAAGQADSGLADAAEPTSEDTAQLAKWLKQFPQADADGDGVLTRQEALEFRKQLPGKRAGASPRQKDRLTSITPTLADVRYGDHPRNLLDFYRADAEKPTPVLIYFHGGGFVGGDKGNAAKQGISRRCLESGISVVSANYRLVAGRQSEPFPGPMLDGARVVEFVRTQATEWNLNGSWRTSEVTRASIPR